MPRHIRSVTARRPRKIVVRPPRDASPPVTEAPSAANDPPSPVKDAPSQAGASGLAPALALFDALRRAFEATPEIPETPGRTRERYVWALESLADYLEDIGADSVWIGRFDELSWALEDLAKGVVAPFLEPASSKGPPPSDPGRSSSD
jgi:hypothetical protein